jgi:hypothetical protein
MENNKQTVKENFKYPEYFQKPDLIEISPEEMKKIWKNIEDCFAFLGFNRWSVSNLLKVRRQTYDRWLRVGTIPDVVIALNISTLLDLPISIILNPSKSCLAAYENKTETYINTLKNQLIDFSKEGSLFISKYWDSNINNHEGKEEILILPSSIFQNNEDAEDLFWTTWSSTDAASTDFTKIELLIVLKEPHFYENDYYLVKKLNKETNEFEKQIIFITFMAGNEMIEVCYNDNTKEEIALSNKKYLLILGRIIKKIT